MAEDSATIDELRARRDAAIAEAEARPEKAELDAAIATRTAIVAERLAAYKPPADPIKDAALASIDAEVAAKKAATYADAKTAQSALTAALAAQTQKLSAAAIAEFAALTDAELAEQRDSAWALLSKLDAAMRARREPKAAQLVGVRVK